ncbi:MAG: peptide ABC transporter permease [Candidatus Eremiobacter antarcticus]|nr:ABC transporter permease [Candidatus Eremiobacteraeota bacterium]MBC5807806.1 ABC transporter permease [Candidatus Eremiobacteraeota bacterium]PZR60779.1 MAG: peptide ABC transporter permease [Candidatus Eremiobacter sp. RRmetagenome_bin22]
MAQAGIALATATLDAPYTSVWTDTWRRFRRSPSALIGLAIIFALAIAAIFAPLISAHADPLAQNLALPVSRPSWQHLAGTDKLGRDIFTRMLFGARLSVEIGFVSVGIALTIGTLIGIISGFWGGALDSALMGLMDVMLAFPTIILAIAISAILDQRVSDVVKLFFAIGIVAIPVYARIARSSVLSVKEMEYVEAARAIGSGTPRLLARYVFPNILAPLIVQATLGVGTAELDSAGLSYLGLGIQPPTPEWGSMLNDARDYWLTAPWALLFPGLAISLTVLGFNLLGDGLRDALDPRSK